MDEYAHDWEPSWRGHRRDDRLRRLPNEVGTSARQLAAPQHEEPNERSHRAELHVFIHDALKLRGDLRLNVDEWIANWLNIEA